LRKQRKEYQKELAELESIEEEFGLQDSQIDRKVWLMCENLKNLEREEMYWHERSHETWLLQGDNNTAFFHKCANGRQRKNTILSLEKDGNLIEGDEKLLEHASEYYAELFGPPVEFEVQMDPTIWDDVPKVSDSDNSFLCRLFSEEEIKIALWKMEKTRQQGLIRSL